MARSRRQSPGYTLKHLDYFVATAEAGSIKLAAENIGISQPSISAAITYLEEELAIQLFVRQHARGLILTSSGKIVLTQVKLLLRQAEKLYAIDHSNDGILRGRLTVGCLVTLAPMIVPELTHAFRMDNPAVELSMTESDPKTLIDSLRRVSIDVAITYDLQLPRDIEFEPLVKLPPHVLVSDDHRFAREKSIRLSDLDSEPLILLDLPYSRQYFLGLFQSQGMTPNIQSRSVNHEVVRTMVANGFGFTIANVRPKNLTALDGRRLVSLQLEGTYHPMTIGIMTLRQDTKPQLLQAFEGHCRHMISESGVPGMNLELK